MSSWGESSEDVDASSACACVVGAGVVGVWSVVVGGGAGVGADDNPGGRNGVSLESELRGAALQVQEEEEEQEEAAAHPEGHPLILCLAVAVLAGEGEQHEERLAVLGERQRVLLGSEQGFHQLLCSHPCWAPERGT